MSMRSEQPSLFPMPPAPDPQGGVAVLRFEVRMQRGRLVNAEGKPIRLREGASATLYLSPDALATPRSSAHSVELLPAGERLRANIHPSTSDPALAGGLFSIPPEELDGTSHGGFVEIVLGEPLRINPAKGKAGELEDVTCTIPALALGATSINHAYTVISERYEPRRRSHTGNVFREVFFHDDKTSRWCPLSVLRDAAVSSAKAAGGG
jgi:hypothetical protein